MFSTSSEPAPLRKRPFEGTRTTNPKTTSILIGVDEESEPHPAIQVYLCRHLLDVFSVHSLRSYATVCLVDCDRLQLYHAGRSVILISSAINLSEDNGPDKFIAVVIAFRYLSPGQDGDPDTRLAEENTKPPKYPSTSSDDQAVQSGNRLEFTDTIETGLRIGFSAVSLGDGVISCDPATLGRSAVVPRAMPNRWPGSDWDLEDECIDRAVKEARKADGEWATKHVPNMIRRKNFELGAGSTFFETVASLLEGVKFEGGTSCANGVPSELLHRKDCVH